MGRTNETILVVDDDAAVRAVVSTMIQRLGYRVLTAADGSEGLRVLRHRAEPVDLVVTDVVMPRMSGPAMLQAMREVDPEVRVLFISGNPDPGLDGGTQLPGQLLCKPFRSSDLALAIRTELDGSRHTAPA